VDSAGAGFIGGPTPHGCVEAGLPRQRAPDQTGAGTPKGNNAAMTCRACMGRPMSMPRFPRSIPSVMHFVARRLIAGLGVR